MKLKFIVLIGFVFYVATLYCQSDSIVEPSIASSIVEAELKAKEISVDLSNPEDVEMVLKKIHTFKYLESIVFEGDAEDVALNKILYRLSVLKNLKSLTFKDNGLVKMPESIAGLKTLEKLTIEGNVGMDYIDLCTRLSNSNISELNLLDNNLKENSIALKKVRSLKKLKISGSNQLDYKELFEELAELPSLAALAIPVNFLTELPDNITKLKALQLLDVSDNILATLPDGLSSLKAINNLSIQGNLLLSPAKDLEKLKGNDIRFLAIDKEVSGEEIEQIKKMFPNAELNFPVEQTEEEVEEEYKLDASPSPVAKNTLTGMLKTKKSTGIQSGAYLLYPSLFTGINYTFDTLRFEERYTNLNYTNVYQRLPSGMAVGGEFGFGWYWFYGNLRKSYKNVFYFYPSQMLSVNYPELRAFSGMKWVYQGELSRRKFRKKILKKSWSDIRIEFDKNNSLFTLYLKSPSGFEKINAYPFVSTVTPIEKTQQTYSRRFLLYQKALSRRAEQFKRTHVREKRRYDINFNNMLNYAWKELQLSMSDEEKLMSREEWLEYYDNIVANEKQALENTPLLLSYFIRRLSLQGIKPSPQSFLETNDNRIKSFDADFVDAAGSGKLAVSNIIIVNTKSNLYSQVSGTLGLAPNRLALKQYSSYLVFVELRNGNLGVVTTEEIDSKIFDPTKTTELKVKVFDKNLSTMGDLMSAASLK
ncbi:MAG: leucine-rich repeat domain-containing protein [Bacteroidia bacterium]|jgi:hypothetical protein